MKKIYRIFHLETGQIIESSDIYRKFKLSNFNPDFTTYMVEKGTVINNSSSLEIKPREIYKNDKHN